MILSVNLPRKSALPALTLAAVLALGQAGHALDSVDFQVPGADKSTIAALKNASALLASGAISKEDAQELFTDARAEYGRLLNALYAQGYYGPVIHVWVNGREAADIAPLDAPAEITSVKVTVDTGPQFHFAQTVIAPLAHPTDLPADFQPGKVAASGVIQTAATEAVDGWRDEGHAKADVASQSITADHQDSTLSAQIGIDPGPVLYFGPLVVKGADRMRVERIEKMAGLTPGLRYSPKDLQRAADRLRRSGVFNSVTLTEDAKITAPNTLGITASVVEAPLRRYSFSGEITSEDGASVTGSWIHRNLFGGGERLVVTAAATNIDAISSGLDYSFGVTLERPATPNADTTAGVSANIGHEDQTDYTEDFFNTGVTFTRWFSDRLTGNLGLSYRFSQGHDGSGDYLFNTLNLPVLATWDSRDTATDPTKGVYLGGGLTPFLGFGAGENGAQMTLDARSYKTFGGQSWLTFAGRLQAGAVVGSTVFGTQRDYLFYSGGGGTVRGQPYQSLGAVALDNNGVPVAIGGTTFVGTQLEARFRVNDTWGLVGFLDAGLVDIGTFAPNEGNWQSGAGIGVRYQTGFGPIRLDVAVPLHDGNQQIYDPNVLDSALIYVGLGQSF
jgi:translocation and assembly module TamA